MESDDEAVPYEDEESDSSSIKGIDDRPSRKDMVESIQGKYGAFKETNGEQLFNRGEKTITISRLKDDFIYTFIPRNEKELELHVFCLYIIDFEIIDYIKNVVYPLIKYNGPVTVYFYEDLPRELLDTLRELNINIKFMNYRLLPEILQSFTETRVILSGHGERVVNQDDSIKLYIGSYTSDKKVLNSFLIDDLLNLFKHPVDLIINCCYSGILKSPAYRLDLPPNILLTFDYRDDKFDAIEGFNLIKQSLKLFLSKQGGKKTKKKRKKKRRITRRI